MLLGRRPHTGAAAAAARPFSQHQQVPGVGVPTSYHARSAQVASRIPSIHAVPGDSGFKDAGSPPSGVRSEEFEAEVNSMDLTDLAVQRHELTKETPTQRKLTRNDSSSSSSPARMHGPVLVITKPLPKVLVLHTGGTLGMDATVRRGAHLDGHHGT